MTQPSSCEKTWNNYECILLKEISQSEKSGYFISNYMTSWKRQNYRGNKISGHQALVGRHKQVRHRGILGQLNNSV